MTTLPCAACGAPIEFHSPASVYAVCAFCHAMVVRRDVDVEAIGTMAELPPDMSPLQIGSEGVYGNVPFTIIGRAKMAWAQGTWNEWFLWCDDNRRGWLAEAQGFFAVSFEIPTPFPLDVRQNIASLQEKIKPQTMLDQNNPSLSHAPVGNMYRFANTAYQLADAKFARCVGSEGELPFTAARGRTAITLDFTGPQDEFACIEFSADAPRVFTGDYIEWDRLRIERVRDLEGWP